MAKMFNPAHPGIVLKEYLGDVSVTRAALNLRVTRTTLSRIINGNASITADMALRLEAALGTSAQMWVTMQANYDLWVASKAERPEIEPILQHA